MSIHELLSPPTWRFLGLSVGLSYIGLGSLALTCQTFSARFFGVLPPASPQSTTFEKSGPSRPSSDTAHPPLVISQAYPIQTSMLLLGIRDLSIGVALLSFWNQGNDDAMSTLILSGMLLCAVDVYVVAKLRGLMEGTTLGLGAGLWLFVGLGLGGW